MLTERDYSTADLFNSVPDLEKARLLDVASGSSGRLWKTYRNILRHRIGQLNTDQLVQDNLIASDEFFKPTMLCETPNQKMAIDARSLPFQDNVFDVITMGYLLDLLTPEEQARSISEAHRVLKHGGFFLGDVAMLRWKHHYGSMWLSADDRKKRRFLHRYMDKRGFPEQIDGYRGNILQTGFNLITEGIGHTQDTKEQWLAYHFVSQK